jgi:hypothetical protein
MVHWCSITFEKPTAGRCAGALCLSAKRTDMLHGCITAVRKGNGPGALLYNAHSESEMGFRTGAEGWSRFGFKGRKLKMLVFPEPAL